MKALKEEILLTLKEARQLLLAYYTYNQNDSVWLRVTTIELMMSDLDYINDNDNYTLLRTLLNAQAHHNWATELIKENKI